MRFRRQNDLFVMTHIPGPSHNYLGLRFGDADRPTLIPTGPAESGPVELPWVLDEVTRGLTAANNQLRTDYRVREIHFRHDDSPREGIYAEMARLLVQAMHEGWESADRP